MSTTLRVRPGEKGLINKALAHNRKHVIKQLANKDQPRAQCMYMIERGSDGYATLLPPGTHRMGTMRKPDDLLPAALIGALAFDTLNGHDAVMLQGDELAPIELKLALTDRSKYWMTPRGTLYSGTYNDKNKKVCFRSGLAGSYEIKHNLDSKQVPTYLLICDEVSYQVVDCWMMPGEEVVRRLKTNSITKKERDKTVSKIELKLNAFMKDGKRVYIDGAIGIEKYEQQIKKIAPTVAWGAKA